MNEIIQITTPLDEETVERLRAGDRVEFNGTFYTGRDVAHKRMVALLENNEPFPFPLQGAVMFYVGPTPPGEGRPIGSAGPTTSTRMDVFAPVLIQHGLKGMIGKGPRNRAVKDAIIRYKALYFAATGGAGALLSKRIIASRVIAFDDLGPEAVRELTVKQFPAVVINDIYGNDVYTQNRKQYAESSSYYSE